MNNTTSQFRASAPFGLMRGDAQFGPLINLAGTWMGKGFNLVSVPQSPSIRNDPNNPNNSFSFIPKIGTTREVFVVAALGYLLGEPILVAVPRCAARLLCGAPQIECRPDDRQRPHQIVDIRLAVQR